MGLVGLLALAVLGWLVLPRRLEANPVEGLCLGFLLCAFGVSAEMFFFDLAGTGWNAWVVLAPWITGAVWLGSKRLPAFEIEWSVWQLAAAAAVLATLGAWGPYERSMPLTSQTWDAWAIWLFKAKAFFVDGNIEGYLARTAEFTGQPGYPLLTPLLATFLYQLEGDVADQIGKATSPAFFLALLGLSHYLVRRAAGTVAAAAFTAIVALTPLLTYVAFELAGYADTALAAYMLAAGGFFYLWLRSGATVDLAAASVAGAAAAWTKNEGQLFLAALGALAAVQLLRQRAGATGWAWLAAPAGLLLVPWSIVRMGQSVEASGFTLGADFQAGMFGTALSTMLAKAFAVGSVNLAFVSLVLAVVAGIALKLPGSFWAIPGLVGWQFLGALLAYSTGRNEIEWWLATSADRLLSQMVPLAIFSAALAYGLWVERLPAEPAPVEPLPAATSAKKAKKRKRR